MYLKDFFDFWKVEGRPELAGSVAALWRLPPRLPVSTPGSGSPTKKIPRMGVFEKVPLSRLPEMGVPPKKIPRMSVADCNPNIRGVTLFTSHQKEIGLMALHTCLSFYYWVAINTIERYLFAILFQSRVAAQEWGRGWALPRGFSFYSPPPLSTGRDGSDLDEEMVGIQTSLPFFLFEGGFM